MRPYFFHLFPNYPLWLHFPLSRRQEFEPLQCRAAGLYHPWQCCPGDCIPPFQSACLRTTDNTGAGCASRLPTPGTSDTEKAVGCLTGTTIGPARLQAAARDGAIEAGGSACLPSAAPGCPAKAGSSAGLPTSDSCPVSNAINAIGACHIPASAGGVAMEVGGLRRSGCAIESNTPRRAVQTSNQFCRRTVAANGGRSGPSETACKHPGRRSEVPSRRAGRAPDAHSGGQLQRPPADGRGQRSTGQRRLVPVER